MKKASYIKNYPEIGDVLFEKSFKAQRIVLTVKPFRGIRVAIPLKMDFIKAEIFVNTKIDWIKKALCKITYHEENEIQIKKKVDEINKKEASLYLKNRLLLLAQKHNFSINNLSIRNQRTRWGSCSSTNNINLNIRLILLPHDLIDYVLLHELVHTKIKNHSLAFWQELEKYVPNSKDKKKRLKTYPLFE